MHWSQAPSIFKHHTPWPTHYASTPLTPHTVLGGRGRQPVAAQRLMQGEQNSWKPRRKQGPHVTTGIWKFNLCAVGCAQNYSFRSCCQCLIHDWYVHVYDIIQNFHSFIDRLTRCIWHLYIVSRDPVSSWKQWSLIKGTMTSKPPVSPWAAAKVHQNQPKGPMCIAWLTWKYMQKYPQMVNW